MSFRFLTRGGLGFESPAQVGVSGLGREQDIVLESRAATSGVVLSRLGRGIETRQEENQAGRVGNGQVRNGARVINQLGVILQRCRSVCIRLEQAAYIEYHLSTTSAFLP